MGGRGGAGGVRNIKVEPAKIGDIVTIAGWFRFNLPSYAISPSKAEIIGESGKAWKVQIETETLDGERDLHFTKYMPKAAALSPSEQRKAELDAEKRYKEGKKKYSKMVEFAKKNGVKGVRTGMRKETILERIKKAGLNYKY